ncbi:MAG: tetratricopeptide repeat protein [Pseudomonadota bacterium]
MSLLQELKRRNVYRVGIAYLATSWVALQLADVVLENLDLPTWAFKALLALIVIGFPIALGLAWAYELTPEGVKRDTPATTDTAAPSATTGQYVQLAITAILAVAVGLLVVDKFRSEALPYSIAPAIVERSIVVLPFKNITAVSDDVFFVDGMHDYLLTQLARLSTLEKVIARPTAESYRDSDKPLQQIANELGVATVLTGGFQRAGDNVRINMQLVRAETGEALWGNTWDRRLTLENLFDTQTNISREVVSALQGVLTEQDQTQLAQRPTDNPDAFEQYSLGRTLLARRTAPNLRAALKNFEQAVELDPDFVLAWVGVADAYSLLTNYSDVEVEASFASRRRAIDRALLLDANSGEALTALAELRLDQGDDESAETYFLQAIERAPHYPTARHWYALLLNGKGLIVDALKQIRIARDIDPQAAILATAEARFLLDMGDYDGADRVMVEGMRRDPDFHNLYGLRADLFRLRGRLDEALRWQDESARLAPTAPEARENQCELQAILGMLDEAQACAERLFEDFPRSTIPGMSEIDLILSIQRGKISEFLVPIEQLQGEDLPKGLKIGMGQSYFLGNQIAEARALIEAARPDMFVSPPNPVAPFDIMMALIIAGIYEAEGNVEDAEEMLEAVEVTRAEVPYIITGGEFAPTIEALGDGDYESAARTLTEPAMLHVWWVFLSPVFERDRENVVFSAAVSGLSEEITRQREAYLASPTLAPL